MTFNELLPGDFFRLQVIMCIDPPDFATVKYSIKVCFFYDEISESSNLCQDLVT